MNDFWTQIVASLIRHGLTVGAGALAAHGISIGGGTVEEIAAAVMALLAMGWSALHKSAVVDTANALDATVRQKFPGANAIILCFAIGATLAALSGCTAAQLDKAQATVTKGTDAITQVCAGLAPLTAFAGPYSVWITGACAAEGAVAKLAADPNGLAWLKQLNADVLAWTGKTHSAA